MRAQDLLLVNVCDITVGCAKGGPERTGRNSLGITGCWEERTACLRTTGGTTAGEEWGKERPLSCRPDVQGPGISILGSYV